ncbi:MAG: hypothetical protein M1380_00670 [Chloroflexi bacterium]|nr:hypothetical protein [Chloroflexota bacterium]
MREPDPATDAIVQSRPTTLTLILGLVDGNQANPTRSDRYAITILDGSNNEWKQKGRPVHRSRLVAGK